MARPVVATTRALAGVDVDQEREVIVAEPDAKALAEALGIDSNPRNGGSDRRGI